MTPPRLSQSEIAAGRRAERHREMAHAIAAGRLVVSQMTPEEREHREALRAATGTRAPSSGALAETPAARPGASRQGMSRRIHSATGRFLRGRVQR